MRLSPITRAVTRRFCELKSARAASSARFLPPCGLRLAHIFCRPEIGVGTAFHSLAPRELGTARLRHETWPKSDISDFGWRGWGEGATMIPYRTAGAPSSRPSPQRGEGVRGFVPYNTMSRSVRI